MRMCTIYSIHIRAIRCNFNITLCNSKINSDEQ